MILYVADIITDAMGLIGATDIDELPSDSEMQLGLRALNVLIDEWATQRLTIRSTTQISFPIVPNTTQYTIGLSGATITAPKPVRLLSAFYRDDTNLDQPIEIIDKQTYGNITDKEVSTGVPLYLSYDPGATQQASTVGTISVYFSPDKPYTVYAQIDTYLTEFVNLSDPVTFEPAYYKTLIYNLAVDIFRRFHGVAAQMPPEIFATAQRCLSNLKSMNSVPILATLDVPGTPGRKYDIFTDQA